MRFVKAAIISISFCLAVAGNSLAAGPSVPLPQYPWSFNGIFGTFDKAQLQRGYKVYKEVCAACHSMDLIHYRNLEEIGFTPEEVRAIASTFLVKDGPNEEGEMFERPGLPSDRFVAPYPNEQAARFANGGAYPPDLSLMTKARADGVNYTKALLVGYTEAPEGFKIEDGQYYNAYKPGNIIAMANPLFDDMVEYQDGTAQTAQQYAADVTAFLAWSAEPFMEERKKTGVRVILFLLVLTGLLYACKCKIWADVKK